MIVSYQVAGHRTYVVSDDRRVGAPSPNEVLMPGNSPQLPPTSVVPHEQTVGEGSMIVFVDDPASGKLIWRGVISIESRVRSPEAGARMAADMARRDRAFDARSLSPIASALRSHRSSACSVRSPGVVRAPFDAAADARRLVRRHAVSGPRATPRSLRRKSLPVTGLPFPGRLSSNCPRYASRRCSSNREEVGRTPQR